MSPDHDENFLPPEVRHREWLLGDAPRPDAPATSLKTALAGLPAPTGPSLSAKPGPEAAKPGPDEPILEASAPHVVTARRELAPAAPRRTQLLVGAAAGLVLVVGVAVALTLGTPAPPEAKPWHAPVAIDETPQTDIPATDTQLNTLPLPPAAQPTAPPQDGTSDSTSGEPAATEPAPSVPAPADPIPVTTDPVPTNPDPIPTDPTPPDPTPTDPAPEPGGVGSIVCGVVGC